MDDDDDDDVDRRNPPPMPSTYVTLVQLEQRWKEKQRKLREKEEQERQHKIEREEEKRKREEEQRQQEDEEANLQKTQVESTAALPNRNRHPLSRTSRWIQSEKSQFRAIVVGDEESKTDDFKKKETNKQRFKNRTMGWKPTGEEPLISGREQLSVEKEDLSEENAVVSTERECEKRIVGKCEGVSSSGGKRGNGKYRRGLKNWWEPRVEEDLSNGKQQLSVEKDAVVSAERECEEEIGRKCEGVSSSGGKRGNGKYRRGVKNWWEPRVQEDLSNGKEQMSVSKKDLSEDNAVVSTERECGKKIGGKCDVVSSSGGQRRNGNYPRREKNWGKPRVEEDLSNGKEQLSVSKEDLNEENAVVSTQRECEKEIGRKCEGVSSSGGRRENGIYPKGVKNRVKPRVEEDLSNGKEQLSVSKEDLSEDNAVVSAERERGKKIQGKCEGVSSSGGRGGNGKCPRGVKNKGKPGVEEDPSNGKEQLPKNEVEAENIAVVSTERHGEFIRNGKDLVVNNGRVWEKKARGVDGEILVGVLGKIEGLSVGSGRGGGGRYGWVENGGPRRNGWSSGRVNSQRVERPRASNLVWVRKEEGEASDANVACD